MKEAMEVIAETRKSTRLLTFVQSGIDSEFCISLLHLILKSLAAGDPSTVSRPEWPRGLNQLGNTCYLNSLLQVLDFCMA
jgi:ubiquitin carboxyl-terminal hydrolase 25/28